MKCVLTICFFVTVFGCSKRGSNIIPGRDVERLSASETRIEMAVFSDTNRVLNGRELCGYTNYGWIPLSFETRRKIKKTLESAEYARLSQSWKLPVEAEVKTDNTRSGSEVLFFEGGFIQVGQEQYHVGGSWDLIVQSIRKDHIFKIRGDSSASQNKISP